MKSTPMTIRLPTDQAHALEELARQQRQQTGELINRVDLIREAVAEYLKRQAKTPDTP
jgi:predicted transcriptional regulator